MDYIFIQGLTVVVSVKALSELQTGSSDRKPCIESLSMVVYLIPTIFNRKLGPKLVFLYSGLHHSN